ncbi:MAG: hypothetical protein ACRCYU_09935 [Nocardioides sp.]
MRFVRRLRSPVGIVCAWVLVVAMGSALVWTVISRAGAHLIPTSSPAQAPASVAAGDAGAPSPAAPTLVEQAARKPIGLRSKRRSGSSAAPRSPSGAASGAASGTEQNGPAASPTPTPSEPTVEPSGGQPEDPPADFGAPERASWDGPGGSIVAECRGADIGLVDASADVGYAADDWATDRRVMVTFQNLADTTISTEVFSTCQRGTPAFFADIDLPPGLGADTRDE